MKTFRRYLTSYVLLLILPILILSIFMFRFIMQYCADQLLERNAGALLRLEAVVEEQTTQMDSIATLTAGQSEFFTRNLKKGGAFYRAQSTLKRWVFANTFLQNAYFYNSELGLVYAGDAVYTPETFVSRRLAEGGLGGGETVAALFESTASPRWISSQPQRGRTGKLLYTSAVRVKTTQRNIMLYEMDLATLQAIIGDAALYRECVTVLCDEGGNVLYTDQDDHSAAIPLEAALASTDDTFRAGGREYLVSSLTSRRTGLRLVQIVPKDVAYSGIVRLRTLFLAALAFIFVVGGAGVIYFMRLNYTPISRLQNAIVNSQLIAEPSDDAFINMNTALHAIRVNTDLFSGRWAAMRKEQIVLKLLLGFYSDTADLDRDAAPLGLKLSGSSWRIAMVRAGRALEEDLPGRIIAEVCSFCPKGAEPLYLEIPESESILFVLPTAQFGAGSAALIEERLARADIRAEVLVSNVYTDISSFSYAYASLLRRGRPQADSAARYAREMLDALANALQFDGKGHILFTLQSLRDLLTDVSEPPEVLSIAYDALALGEKWLEGDAEAVAQACRLRTSLFGQTGDAWKAAQDALTALSDAIRRAEDRGEDGDNERIAAVREYIAAHFADPELTVQRIAEQFGLSVSNLSHYFKKHTGTTVSDLLQAHRIGAAQQLLRGTDLSVGEIGLRAGYSQTATFTRAFKKACGVSPLAYREAGEGERTS